jgi:hypothetical protein
VALCAAKNFENRAEIEMETQKKQQRLVVLRQQTVEFYGNDLAAVCADDNQIYVSVRHLCHALGIDTQGQTQRIRRHAILAAGERVCKLHTVQGLRIGLVLRLDLVPLWLSGLKLSHLKLETRRKVAAIRNQTVIEKKAYVYLISAAESNGSLHHKIGYTAASPEKHTTKLSGRSPLPLTLEHVITRPESKARQLEKELHKRYDHLRIHHEWFKLRPNHVQEIMQL